MDEEDSGGQWKGKALDVWQKKKSFNKLRNTYYRFGFIWPFLVKKRHLHLLSTSTQHESYPRMPSTGYSAQVSFLFYWNKWKVVFIVIYLHFFQSYQVCIYGSHMTFPLPSALKELLRAIISLLACLTPLENAIYCFSLPHSVTRPHSPAWL